MAKEETLSGLRTVLAGGTDREGGGDGPLLCLLHGYGASGDDLAGLWRVLDVPRETRFAFPEAPLSLAQSFGFPSFAWWHIDVERFNVRLARARSEAELRRALDEIMNEEPTGLAEARKQTLSWLSALRAHLRVPAGRVVIGGFSQGAMLATDLALHLPADERPAGLLQLSGALINRPRWQERLAAVGPLPRYQSHGMQDMMLPFPLGVALHEFLEGTWPGTFQPFHGGHEIPPAVIEGMSKAVTGFLGG